MVIRIRQKLSCGRAATLTFTDMLITLPIALGLYAKYCRHW